MTFGLKYKSLHCILLQGSKTQDKLKLEIMTLSFWIEIEIMTLPFCFMIQKPRIRIEFGNHDIVFWIEMEIMTL